MTDSLGDVCELHTYNIYKTSQPVQPTDEGVECDSTAGMQGSVSFLTNLILPAGKVLLIEVGFQSDKMSADTGFFVRPTRRTREWGAVKVERNKATFYLADTGQYSVEFVPPEFWRTENALSYDALMLFVNPELEIPTSSSTNTEVTVIQPANATSDSQVVDLGPDRAYIFKADNAYDWGRDQVYKVHSNTKIYFEPNAYVRARIVQTEEKVNNVLISGYGILDTHYDLQFDWVGVSDDATHQSIGIYGKNIRIHGITIINTNPTCHTWGYCLEINANWSPLNDIDTINDPFGADELQVQDPLPRYKPRRAHCQENNMDDSPNTDFTNCPQSYEEQNVCALRVGTGTSRRGHFSSNNCWCD